MMFMNEYEVNDALQRYAGHPILGPATRTLEELVYWTNTHSDGWAYWPKPCRAAAKLQELLTGDGTWFYRDQLAGSVNEAEYRKALKPIKAFRTRQGADFAIYDVGYAEV